MLIGTEISEFRPLGAKKMGLKDAIFISKNMTKSIFPQTQLAWGILISEIPVLVVVLQQFLSSVSIWGMNIEVYRVYHWV